MTETSENNQQDMKPPLSTLRKICYSAIITIFVFSVVEGVLRLVRFQFEPKYSIYVENRWTKHGVGPDPTLGWSWMPIPGATCVIDKRSSFQFNSLGYRGPLFQTKKPEGTIRIVCLGDSGTMGWGVKDGETYCEVLQDLLQKQCNQKVETINGGVFGYSSFQGVHQLRTRILELHPDFITFCYNWNDHGGAIRMAEQAGNYAWEKGLPQKDKDLPRTSSLGGVRSYFSKLRLYQLISYAMLHFRKMPETEPEEETIKTDLVRVPLEDYRENLMEVIRISRKNQIVPIFLTQALNPISPYPLKSHDAYNEIVVDVARKENVPYVDARELLKGDSKLFSSNTHPTRKGHQKIAVALSKTIQPLMNCMGARRAPLQTGGGSAPVQTRQMP